MPDFVGRMALGGADQQDPNKPTPVTSALVGRMAAPTTTPSATPKPAQPSFVGRMASSTPTPAPVAPEAVPAPSFVGRLKDLYHGAVNVAGDIMGGIAAIPGAIVGFGGSAGQMKNPIAGAVEGAKSNFALGHDIGSGVAAIPGEIAKSILATGQGAYGAATGDKEQTTAFFDRVADKYAQNANLAMGLSGGKPVSTDEAKQILLSGDKAAWASAIGSMGLDLSIATGFANRMVAGGADITPTGRSVEVPNEVFAQRVGIKPETVPPGSVTVDEFKPNLAARATGPISEIAKPKASYGLTVNEVAGRLESPEINRPDLAAKIKAIDVNSIESPSQLHSTMSDAVGHEPIAVEPIRSNVTKSMQLNSGIDPGIDKLIEHDITPAVRGLYSAFKETTGGLNPAGASEEALRTADIVRNAKATVDNAASIEATKYKEYFDHFKGATNEQNIGNISSYEKTGKFADAPPGYSDFYKKSTDAAHEILKKVYGEDRPGFIENYVRRQFKFNSTVDEQKGLSYLSNKQTSSKAPLKGRIHIEPLDETLAQMRARGIKVEPASTNPEELRQWTVANARRAAAYAEAWGEMKSSGLVVGSEMGRIPPAGLVPLSTDQVRAFAPMESGVKSKTFYADPTVARIIKNSTGRGLEQYATYRGARAIENAMNQFQLGFSGFHLAGTGINAGISDLAAGLKSIAIGKPLQGTKMIGRSLIPMGSFARDMFRGRSLIEGLKNNSPEAYKFVEEKLNPGGGRLGLDARYRASAWENMMKAWNNGNVVGAGVRLPGALMQAMGKPLMEYAIPRVKLGAFMDLAELNLSKMPNATPEESQRALADAWDSIDNRFGQLVYDNLFWNKTFKDLAMLSTRSVGWNLGTVRELGGGIADGVKAPFTGKVTDRTLFSVALPLYVGLIGAVITYLATGKGPKELKDYFFPKNGLTDANGNPDRLSMPTYMKDVYSYALHPGQTITNKVSPFLQTVYEYATNKNYYGDMIRNPNDPISTQLQQVGSDALSRAIPFSLTSAARLQKEGASPLQQVGNVFGFNKAPAEEVTTPKENVIKDALTAQNGGFAPRTPEQAAIDNLKAEARLELKQGKTDALKQLIKQGVFTSTRSLQDFVKGAKLNSTQRAYELLNKVNKAKVKLKIQKSK